MAVECFCEVGQKVFIGGVEGAAGVGKFVRLAEVGHFWVWFNRVNGVPIDFQGLTGGTIRLIFLWIALIVFAQNELLKSIVMGDVFVVIVNTHIVSFALIAYEVDGVDGGLFFVYGINLPAA